MHKRNKMKKFLTLLTAVLMIILSMGQALPASAGAIVTDVENHLNIKKQDALTDAPIQGITFELRDASTGTGTSAVTNASGIATWSMIPDGNYDVVETATTAGYILSSTTYPIKVVNGYIYLEDNTDVTNEEVAFIVKNSRPAFKIIKTDAETASKISNVVFTIDGTDYMTDGTGEIDITSLTPGAHTVVEKTPGKYVVNGVTYDYVPDDTEYTFTLNNNGTVTCAAPFTYDAASKTVIMNLTNTKQAPTAKVKVIKTDSLSGQALKDAEFTLSRYEDGNWATVEAKQTNTSGTAVFEGLTQGHYKIVETGVPEGYHQASTWTREFDITTEQCYQSDNNPDNQNYHEFVYTFNVTNTPNSFFLYKVDSDTAEPLRNAVFRITKDGAANDAVIAEDETGTAIINGTELQTDGEGYIKLYALKNGTYHYTETQAPGNYITPVDEHGDPIVQTFTVANSKITSGEHNGYDVISDPITNTDDYTLSIFIRKLQDDEVTEITDAEFAVYQWDDTAYDETTDSTGKYDTSTPVARIVYKETPKVASNEESYNYFTEHPLEFTEQNLGKFKIVETATATGFFADWEQEVQIDTTSNQIDQELIFDVDDAVINTTNTLTVEKVDAYNNDPLKGATFRLETYIREIDQLSFTGSVYSSEKTIDPAGAETSVTFRELPTGNYKLTEIAAPENYLVSDETFYFIVNQDGNIVEAELPESDSPLTLVPKTGASYTGSVSCVFKDYYNDFQIHKFGLPDPEDESTKEKLENVKFQIKAGTERSNGSLKYYPDGTFLGYLAKGMVETGTPETDAYGTKVYQNDYVITDENGDIELRMMIDGKYEYTEVSTVGSYNLPEIATAYFTVENGKINGEYVHEVEIVNRTEYPDTYGTVNVFIEKVDGNTGDHITGVTFDVYEYDVTTGDYHYLTTLIEDAEKGDGFYRSEEDSLGKTVSNGGGRFRIVETANEDGYISDWSAEIDGNEKDEWEFYGDDAVKNFPNELTIRKYEAMSNMPLADAVIEVWTSKESDTVIGYLEDGTEVTNHQQFTTDDSGKIVIRSLINDRTYYAQEKEAPTGFTLDKRIRASVVTADGYIFDENDIPEPNTFRPDTDGTFVIEKYDEETGDPIEGAYFEIWKEGAEDKEVIGHVVVKQYVDDDEHGDPIYEDATVDLLNHTIVSTNALGKIQLSDLASGNYGYQDMDEVESFGEFEIGIPNTMGLATGGTGRTMIYIAGCVLLALMAGGFVIARKRKTKANIEK